MRLSKRDLLRLSGIAITAGLAGCQTSTGDDDNERETTERETSEDGTSTVVEDQEAEIEFVDTREVTTLPIVRPDTVEDVARVELEITDPDGLQAVSVAYSDEYRDEAVLLYEETGAELDTESGTQTIRIAPEFPRRVVAPRTGEFTVDVTDTNGNTQTSTQAIDGLKGSYRADRKRRADTDAELEDIGNYTTDRNWDNLVTNTQQISDLQQQWLNEAAYTPLVNQIMGEDFESGGNVYPNYGDGNNRGFFDQDAVRNEDSFETLVRWYLPAIMDHDDENYGYAPSSRNQRFAATLEILINEHHPSVEAKTTDVKSFPAHGIFGVQDQNNEEFYLVDTTASSPQFDQAVARIGDGFITSEDGNRSELWDPYHEFEPGPVEYDITYQGKSRSARLGLVNFVDKKGSNDQLDYDRFFITDEWMDEAYNVLRNGGSIDPIVEPIEELIFDAIRSDNENKVGIYGTLDDTRMAVDSTGEIYEAVKLDETQTPGIEEIETMLETAPAQ